MRNFILVLIIIFVLISCQNATNSPNDKGVIIPFRIGNEWVYQIDTYDEQGKHIINTDFINTMVIDIIEDWYSVVNFPSIASHVKFQNKSDGLHAFGGGPQYNGYFSALLFQYPTKVNNVYNFLGWSILVKNTNKLVSTNIGDFKCIEYEQSPANKYNQTEYNYVKFYIAPNIGIIKIEHYKYKKPDINVLNELTTIFSKNF